MVSKAKSLKNERLNTHVFILIYLLLSFIYIYNFKRYYCLHTQLSIFLQLTLSYLLEYINSHYSG